MELCRSVLPTIFTGFILEPVSGQMRNMPSGQGNYMIIPLTVGKTLVKELEWEEAWNQLRLSAWAVVFLEQPIPAPSGSSCVVVVMRLPRCQPTDMTPMPSMIPGPALPAKL